LPDWISHIAIAYSLAVLLKIKRRELVVAGALLPDVFKAFIPLGALIGYGQTFFIGNYLAPLHTLLGVTLSALLVATFFQDMKKVLPLLLLGAYTHLSLDSLLYPFGYENWFLWPFFTFKSRGILWPDSLFTPLAASSIAITLKVLIDRKAK